MIQNRIDIWNPGEYNYPAAFGFIPNLMTYLHDEDDDIRPGLLIIPGGGYEFVSAREGELVALEFFDRGYNCFVLTYTVNLMHAVPLRMQALEDAARAMRLIRRIAPAYRIDPEKIAVMGFSAGGHLAASLCVHYKDTIEIDTRLSQISPRPDAAILCYPVITSGELSHGGTIRSLLGFSSVQDDFEPEVAVPDAEKWLGDNVIPGCATREDQLYYVSVDKHVTNDTPPTFLWHTMDDQTVPLENSLIYMNALRRNGVPRAIHIFSNGRHGLSLANKAWAEYGQNGSFTYEQVNRFTRMALDGKIGATNETKKELVTNSHFGTGVLTRDDAPVPEVTVWPELADRFLRHTYGMEE
ncbi:MAG: alpha/beta hydrolase [Lachnospiraceae bacterium]|nr:alpha/beta hydrolase [Lachnospiraceae bacterium]